MNIKQCEENDFAPLKEVFKKIYPSNRLLQNKNYFDWQFRDHPWNEDDGYTMWILWDNREIAGFYGWVPLEIVYKGSVRIGCEPACWWAEKRSKSGGLKLLNRVMNNYSIRLYHDCSEDSVRIFDTYGMPLFPVPRWLYVLNAEQVSSVFGIGEIACFQTVGETQLSRDNNAADYHISRLESFEDEEKMTFDACLKIKNHLHYTGEYLRWRYVAIPFHDYRIITSGEKGEYGVYRFEKIRGSDYSIIRILEWSFGYDTGWRAVRFLKDEGTNKNAILMDFFCSSEAIGQTLQSYGFISNTVFPFSALPRLFQPIYFPYRDLITCVDTPPYRNREAIDFGEWYITKGNSDADRNKIEGVPLIEAS